MNKAREYLREHSKAKRDIELTSVVIDILETVTGMQSVIATLKRKQHAQLHRVDKYAALLGAPYKKEI